MPKSHYEVLGVGIKSSAEEIRSAYRKIVLDHHPDRSSAPESKDIFLIATQAYEVLSDAGRRLHYDASLRADQIRAEQDKLKAYAARKNATGAGAPSVRTDTVPKAATADASANLRSAKGSVTVDVTRLTMLFTRAQYGEAERLAKRIIDQDARQPIPYAVLGDLARQRGELAQAAKMYAYAVQMDPNNSLYQQRHEELLGAIQPNQVSVRAGLSNGLQIFAPMVGAAVILMAALYLCVGHETPLMPGFSPVSTWTFGLVVLLFLSGVAIGASFSVAQLTDRFTTVTKTTLGRLSPYVALSILAAVSFWFAALLYVVLGVARRTFNYSTTRLVAMTAAATLLLAGAAAINVDGPSPMQTLFWGGNLVYVGAVIGWMVADSLQH